MHLPWSIEAFITSRTGASSRAYEEFMRKYEGKEGITRSDVSGSSSTAPALHQHCNSTRAHALTAHDRRALGGRSRGATGAQQQHLCLLIF